MTDGSDKRALLAYLAHLVKETPSYEAAAVRIRNMWLGIAGVAPLEPMVFPDEDGMLAVEWSVGDRCIEVDVPKSGPMEWAFVDLGDRSSNAGGEAGTAEELVEILTGLLPKMDSLDALDKVGE